MVVDIWKRGGDRTNSNLVILGSSGQGKSTVVKKLIANERMMGTKLIIIDLEAEYGDVTKSLGGAIINMGGEKGDGILNPLDIKNIVVKRELDEDMESMGGLATSLQALVVFFALYLEDANTVKKELLNETLIELYKNFDIDFSTKVDENTELKMPIMEDLYLLLEEKYEKAKQEKINIEEYKDLVLLIKGIARGSSQFLFNGQTNIKREQDVVCLVTQNLNNVSESFNIINWCWDEIRRNRNERIMLICDEAYLLIDPKISQTLIGLKNIEKSARKYEGALCIVGEPLAGAVIKIENPLFAYEQEFTTNADGEIFVENLKQGTYEITEVKAPNGYNILSDERKTAIVTWGEEISITYENTQKTSLKITKIDSETGELLDGARFKLEHTESGAVYNSQPTKDGVVVFEDLIDGTYVLTETHAPQGYILVDTPQNVVVKHDRVNEVTVKNPKKPSLVINKIGNLGKEPLVGAKFSLYFSKDNKEGTFSKIGDYTTDNSGKIKFKELEIGWYKLVETQAPAGYEIGENAEQEFFLKANENKVITLEDTAKKALVIKKVDAETGEPLAGAYFSISIISDGASSSIQVAQLSIT